MEFVIAVLAVAFVALAVNVSKAWRRRSPRGVAFTRVLYRGPVVYLADRNERIGCASDVKVQHRQVSLFVPLTGSTDARAALLRAARNGERVSIVMVVDAEVWSGSGLVTAVFDEHALHPWCVRLELGGMTRDLRYKADPGAAAENLSALCERVIAPQAAA